MKILIINGPNLNLTGIRDQKNYGIISLDEINAQIENHADRFGVSVGFFQSNSEGDVIDAIHAARSDFDGIIINPAAYTHYSYAIRDAVDAVNLPVIEVHMSNVNAREEFRHKSVIAPACAGQISGLGKYSYIAALYALTEIYKNNSK
ncbi:MAG: type II 3-dehydroquinate dehydratase [Eubacteriales bacterium]|nr:type II 3-dehydroquinate dehydratase [Eubacteriales bacterium]